VLPFFQGNILGRVLVIRDELMHDTFYKLHFFLFHNLHNYTHVKVFYWSTFSGENNSFIMCLLWINGSKNYI